MKIYEIEIKDECATPLTKTIFDQFVVLAKTFDEAKEKADKYLKDMTPPKEKLSLVIKSISEKYVIKQGL